MRIALVNHRDWLEGGMDKVALTHLAKLRERGIEAELFAQYHPQNQNTVYRQFFPKNADRLDYKLSWRHAHRLPGDILGTFYNAYAGQRFGAFLDIYRPDVVHVHGLLRAFSPAIYDEANSRGIPLIQTHHYVKLICPSGKLLKGEKSYCSEMPCLSGNSINCILHRCQQRSLPKSIIAAMEFRINRRRYSELPDIHLAPSRYLQSLLKQAGVNEEKLFLHPNFVDTNQFYPLPEDEYAGGQYFLYSGRLAEEKGIKAMLDAFAPLKELPLYLAGAGPLTSYCQRRIEQEGLSHIHYLGHLDEKSLLPWIQNARATLIPSLWGEIFGLTILESFACGIPVIGAHIGAIPELINHAHNGLLVKPGNVESLRDAVLQMAILSQDTIRELGANGLALVHKGYTLKHHMEQLLHFYQYQAVAA